MTAEITKVASRYRAGKLRVGVAITKDGWDELCEELEILGTHPKVFDVAGGRIWFNDKVPLSYDPLPPHIPSAYVRAILRFDKHPEGLGGGETIDLMCPPQHIILRCSFCGYELSPGWSFCENCHKREFYVAGASQNEYCTTDGHLGICPVCHKEKPVMGPFAGEQKFLMRWHQTGPDPELLRICFGTCQPPEGEVRRNPAAS